MPDVRKIIEGMGLNAESFDRIRLARGVVGKASYAAAAAILALAAVALQTSNIIILGAVIAAVVILFLAYLFGVLWFAARNPGVALLEGAELIQWRQMDVGMKGETSLPTGPNIEPPPQIGGPTS